MEKSYKYYMKYDFAHPKFKNGMVTFAEKKPDLVYEFRMAAARRKYNLRQDMYLYNPNGEKMAKVENFGQDNQAHSILMTIHGPDRGVSQKRIYYAVRHCGPGAASVCSRPRKAVFQKAAKGPPAAFPGRTTVQRGRRRIESLFACALSVRSVPSASALWLSGDQRGDQALLQDRYAGSGQGGGP